MDLYGFRTEVTSTGRRGGRVGIVISVALHLLLVLGLFFWIGSRSGIQFVAAGEGEGGEGGGGSIDVGIADPSALFGFAKPRAVSFVGDSNSALNNAKVETAHPTPERPDEVLPSKSDKPDPDSIKTDRPVAPRTERVFTGKDERGRSPSTSVDVGRSYGSPTPATVGGVGIGSGGGIGAGNGLPGGSEYGRRIQGIFSRNYNPSSSDAASQYIIVLVRIARDGRILSVENGRVAHASFKQRSQSADANYAVERSLLASNPLPPFPAGFLTGVQEAVAEVWFRYPK